VIYIMVGALRARFSRQPSPAGPVEPPAHGPAAIETVGATH
jgi:hypothetical protein